MKLKLVFGIAAGLGAAAATAAAVRLGGHLLAPAPAAAPASSAPAASAAHLTPGAQRVLHVRSEHQTVMGGAGSAAAGLRLVLEADLRVGYVGAEGDGLRLRGSLDEPSLAVTDGNGAPLDTSRLGDLAGDLRAPFYFTVDDAGRVRTLAVTKGTGALVRGLVRTLVSNLQATRGEGPRWTSLELDPTGVYEAEYTRLDAHAVQRTKERYTRIATARGLVPTSQVGAVTARSRAHLEVDAQGFVVGARVTERTSVAFERGVASATSVGELTARLVSAAPDLALLGSYAREQATLEEAGMAPVGELLASERQSDEVLVGGAKLEDLTADLRRHRSEEATRAHTMARLEALVRLDPSAARRLLVSLRTEDEATRQALLASLGGAGTEEAVEALADAAEDAALSDDTRASAARSLGLATPATPRAAEALTSLTESGRGETRSAASLALGSVARGLAGDHPDLTQSAVTTLTRELTAATSAADRIVFLRALGNIGDAAVLPLARAALADPEPTVRMAAATALRFVPGDEADALLAQTLLRDSDMDVREEAAEACGYRAIDAHLASFAEALGKEPLEHVRLEIVRALVRAAPTSPEALALARKVAATDASDEVRALAAAALQG